MFANTLLRNYSRNNRSSKGTKAKAQRRESYVLESLESRLLLSADLLGVPDWNPEGPRPIINGSAVVDEDNSVTGAVQSVAVNPNDPMQIYVGSVNGGIWRTDNADPANPGDVTWTPLTDQMPSLAIGSIEFSPLDPTGNTLYAGTGTFSNLFNAGGPAVGILRTTDGGQTWQNFAVNPGNEGRIKAVLPTGIDMDDGAAVQEMILVATIDGGAGIWRSDDNGETFTLLSGANGLGIGTASQLIGDPNDPNRFYAALPGLGVYQGNFDPVTEIITWNQVNTGIAAGNITSSGNIQIAAQDNAGNTTLFAALADPPAAGTITATLTDVVTSTDDGANWTSIGTPAGFNAWRLAGSGMTMVADPANAGVVYLGGLGGNQLFRFDPGPSNWVLISGAGAANGTRPHVDPRDMTFIGNDILLETDDGGVYFLQNPTDAINNEWHSFAGETSTGQALGGVEFHNVAWDSNSDVIIAGAQDNGTNIQQVSGDLVWTNIFGSDGGDVKVDNFTLAAADQSIRYFSTQNLGSFSREVYDNTNASVGGVVALLPTGNPNNDLAGFVGQFINPIEINAIAPTQDLIDAGQSTRMVIGGGTSAMAGITVGAVYESSNAGVATTANIVWTQVPVQAGAAGSVSALAYGGRLNGVDNPDVLYAGIGGVLYVRDTAGGTLTATSAAFPGANIRDIALDPNDWRHAFVASSTGVWETTDAGDSWIPHTGNLQSQTTDIRAIEFAELGDVDAVLVGGLGGTFRMITNNPGVWTEFGAGLPNAVAYDLEYNATDDVLLVGSFGGGAWTVGNASDFLLVPGVLQISGDEDHAGQDDTIILVRNEANPSLLDVSINGHMSQFQLSVLQLINVNGLAGNDTLIVDSSNGLINVVDGIRYDGGTGFDELQLLQTDGTVQVSDTYTVGPAIGSGMSTIVGPGTDGTQTVQFQNVEPVIDLVPALSLTVNATATGNAISYTAGSVAGRGLISIDEHESIEFANKTTLTINAGAGQDNISLNNPDAPIGLAGISINGGAPAGGDTLIITGVGADVAVNTTTSTISGATGAGGAILVNYAGIETLELLDGIADLAITTTSADDTVTVTPGSNTGANSGTVQSSGAVPEISFVNSGDFSVNLGLGNDTLIVNASAVAETIAVSGAAVAIAGRRPVDFTGAESLVVNGGDGSDTFDVTASVGTAIFIDGGDPIGTLPGDRINIDANGAAVTYNPGPETDEGSFVIGANQPVSFDQIESLSIADAGPVVINATNGPDAITVIARDGSTHAGTDGVQDFSVAVNTGPELLFVDAPSLTINALGGSDQITLQTPAPNGAIWNVDTTINGGPPAGDTDQVIVQTPGAVTAAYTPTAFDAATLNLSSLTSMVSLAGVESVVYDGQGFNDTLSVLGTGGDDTIVHTPGTSDQSGNIVVNSLLGLGYQNLGGAANLTADGQGGSDELVYNGTAANDSFTIGAAGEVTLNTRVVLNTANVEILTLEGFSGDDSFTLVPAISASVYPTINLNGGTQASSLGDRVNLVATAGADDIAISGGTVSLGAVSVHTNGVEDIRLDALGGDDLLTYNGVSGLSEDILVQSSGVAGGGELRVENVVLVKFSGVERIDVHGNAPTLTETDTLTFAGTNADDLFAINLAADGTDADPILMLQDSSATTLLTLRNYTNFETLNVLGLDGEDTFNVATDATGPSRNLHVDGGQPTGKKKSTDQLNVTYIMPRPRIMFSTEIQNPQSGQIDLDYDPVRFLVTFSDIENFTIRKA